MSEYERTRSHQFCDTELVMILDRITGEPISFSHGNAIGTLDEALEYLSAKSVRNQDLSVDREIIVKMQCIKGFKL